MQSKERLNELLEKYRLTGDMNVRNEIVLMYMDLVKMIAVSMRNIYTGYAESDDIINEGVIAVSYTHLDVYKRQAYVGLHRKADGHYVAEPLRSARHDGFLGG